MDVIRQRHTCAEISRIYKTQSRLILQTYPSYFADWLEMDVCHGGHYAVDQLCRDDGRFRLTYEVNPKLDGCSVIHSSVVLASEVKVSGDLKLTIFHCEPAERLSGGSGVVGLKSSPLKPLEGEESKKLNEAGRK
ncbi:hypothetical protein CEXT_744561 [Caerostris extrusa]|uniref:Uncharacterized protein n=1 Tax=Caerostris extrusa TaxID=172846 RepID=A0AAV4MJ09_CAEEX|nr:hypothetical protein CEXT_744561 [Caerostris extrusa]